jgi:protein-S-isoprenylcysteine O-methyltransferase Ste14
MSTSDSTPDRGGNPVTRHASWVGRFVFKYRDYLAPAVGILILAYVRPRPLFGSERADRWLDLVGVLVALTGQSIRATVIGLAYIVRGGANKQLAAPRLVREGFYAHSRNPMYVGNFLILTGIALIYNSRWVYLIILPGFVLGILAIIKAEEDFLAAKFGAEYDDYCRRVNRFLPSLRGLRTTLAGMRFDWRRVVRKEYGTTFAWTSAAVVLLAIERITWHGFQDAAPALIRLVAAWGCIFALYLFALWLKKTHRLHPASS